MSSSCSKKNSKPSSSARTRRSRGRSSAAEDAAVTSRGKIVAAAERRRSSKSDEVSEKLSALKNLISSPAAAGEGGDVAAEELFRETADYILRLKAQVVVLQRLIQLSSCKDGGADVKVVS